MATFILRRLVASFFIVLAASFIVYVLMANAGDPLEFLREITNPTEREAIQRSVTEALNLDVPPVQRYFHWLADVLRGDFGISARTRLPVNDELAARLPTTLKLVAASWFLSIILGVSIGVVTALRQYSAFDYIVTFFTFVFFSLPVFWVAVILKDLGGIRLNDWLRDGGELSTFVIVLGAISMAVLAFSIAGGRTTRRMVIAAGSGVVFGAFLTYLSRSGWFSNPSIGWALIPLSLGVAIGVTAVLAGIANRKALLSAVTVAVIGLASYFPLQGVFNDDSMDLTKLLLMGLIAIVVGVGTGYAYGGFDKGLSAKIGGLVAFLVGLMIFVDRIMLEFSEYTANSIIRGRPIKTIGDRETRLEGNFWLLGNDVFTHLVLPTITLMLISLAGYTRYSRASMLEVLNQDYIRTARAKGLSERTVVVRHGLRNALIPLATIVAFDIGGILGGAVITESVFEWNGMGRLFIEGLRSLDPNPVMAFFVVVGVTAVLANLLADIVYSILDPRIRLTDS